MRSLKLKSSFTQRVQYDFQDDEDQRYSAERYKVQRNEWQHFPRDIRIQRKNAERQCYRGNKELGSPVSKAPHIWRSRQPNHHERG